MNPLLKSVLRGLSGVGTRAVANAFDSALTDVDAVTANVRKRIKKAKKRLADIPRIEEDPDDNDGE